MPCIWLSGDYLWDDRTGLPKNSYGPDEVMDKVDAVFGHVFRAYPGVPSPYYTLH